MRIVDKRGQYGDGVIVPTTFHHRDGGIRPDRHDLGRELQGKFPGQQVIVVGIGRRINAGDPVVSVRTHEAEFSLQPVRSIGTCLRIGHAVVAGNVIESAIGMIDSKIAAASHTVIKKTNTGTAGRAIVHIFHVGIHRKPFVSGRQLNPVGISLAGHPPVGKDDPVASVSRQGVIGADSRLFEIVNTLPGRLERVGQFKKLLIITSPEGQEHKNER